MDLEELDSKLDSVVIDIKEIKTALKGYNGQIGLCQQVEKNTKAINKIWICIAVIASSIGGGIYGIVKVLMG